MTTDTKDRIASALRAAYGNAADNAHRARSSWRGLPADDMSKEYGESGRTRAALLAEYEKEEREAKAAWDEFMAR